jgi:RimJ/RimL family protein N-acetyltransferase
MNILGHKVKLRALEPDDVPSLHRWANDPEIWRMLGGWHFPSSQASTRTWLDGLAGDRLSQRFAIEGLEDGVLLGTANIIDIDWKNGHAFHGMMLGDTATRGKGYGLDTVMAVMRYAFDELRLERLDGDIIEYNEASHRLYVGKCGWREEGRQRRWYFREGQRWDKVLVGVTRQDYADLVAANRYWNPA